MTAALLVMDYQNGIVDRLGSPEVLAAAGRAVDAARDAGIPVVFVRVAFRAGLPEISPRNRRFGQMLARADTHEAEDASVQIHDTFHVRPTEPIVTKRRVSAFAGSDLDVVLRAGGIDHLVLAGISTSGVVLSTVRQASDLDFALTVLADACADQDAEAHRVLLENVFPKQADVVTVSEWAGSLGA